MHGEALTQHSRAAGWATGHTGSATQCQPTGPLAAQFPSFSVKRSNWCSSCTIHLWASKAFQCECLILMISSLTLQVKNSQILATSYSSTWYYFISRVGCIVFWCYIMQNPNYCFFWIFLPTHSFLDCLSAQKHTEKPPVPVLLKLQCAHQSPWDLVNNKEFDSQGVVWA